MGCVYRNPVRTGRFLTSAEKHTYKQKTKLCREFKEIKINN